MTVKDLIEKHGFTPLSLPDPERTVSGCYIGDLLSWVMGRAKGDNVWLTIMSNVNTVAVASLSDVSLVLLAENVRPEDAVLSVAEAKGVNVAATELPLYEAALALRQDV
ncbi:MAG: hypothetical protein IK104_03790 [Clostridia bacterium]|nr:hypothetical protein [Clostridia bacterium]